MQPLVSILIPAYNAELYIAETLDSAITQTWQNIEIIVIDDGSIDNSRSIAKKYESSQVKVITQENMGAASARNRALQEAQGDFIQYLDADDVLSPNKIESQIHLIQHGYSNFLIAGAWTRFHNDILEAKFMKEPVWQDMSSVDWLVCSWNGGGMMHPAAWLVPRRITELAGKWNPTLSVNDDGEYFCRVILASEAVKFCAEAKSFYRSNLPFSLSRRGNRTAIESEFNSARLCITHILAVENTALTRHASANLLQRFIYSVYPDHLDLVKDAEKQIDFLGGSTLKIEGGRVFKSFSKLLGWKLSKRIQKLVGHQSV